MSRIARLTSLIMVVALSLPMTVSAALPYTRGDGVLGTDTEPAYERIPQTSHIIIDREGYLPSAKKVFYIYGQDLGTGFQVINMKNDDVVFTGSMTLLDTGDKNTSLYIGDYSTLVDEGSYRIYQDDVGYSDEFAIDSDIYKDMYAVVSDEVYTCKYDRDSDMLYTLANVMLTKEIYPSASVDEEYLRSRMDYLIEKKDELNAQDTTITADEAGMMAGVLAQYCYLYKDADLMYYNTTLSVANVAYNLADSLKTDISTDVRYYAAAMLYRVTGYAKYLNAIAECDALTGRDRHVSSYDYTMLGDMAYLNTSYRTDYTRCENIFDGYVDQAEAIAASADKAHYYVQMDIADLDDTEILDNMMILGMVSYVLSSHEYASIQGNYLHYMFGVNKDKCNHLTEAVDDEEGTVTEDVLLLSKLMFVLGSNDTSASDKQEAVQ